MRHPHQQALAFEATKFRVTREFFEKHTVSELMEQSDYWLEMQGRLTEPMRYDAATDRYGAASTQRSAVAAAWSAVSVS